MPSPVTPAPLSLETVLDRRFRVVGVLGQGPMGLVYEALDAQGDLPVVVKELAPYGTTRAESGHVVWGVPAETSRQAARLFVEDAERIRRAHPPRVPPVRGAFHERSTAYVVRPYDADALPLQTLLDRGEPLGLDATLDILMQLIETLERAHARRLLHRGLKPSNVLLGPRGDAWVVDFGLTRDWLVDRQVLRLGQPLFAAPEQRAPLHLRGAATDVFGLSAIAYAMAFGIPPHLDSVQGGRSPVAAALLPESHRRLVRAIEAGLEPAMSERPATVAAFRAMLVEGVADRRDPEGVSELDARLVRIQRLKHAPNESPGGGVLERPKPLKAKVCPVCAVGTIVKRPIHERLCPACRVGVVHLRKHTLGHGPCPVCRYGLLKAATKNPFRKTRWACGCGARFEGTAQALTQTAPENAHADEARPYDLWLAMAERGNAAMVCDGCQATFDLDGDRWRRIGTDHEISRYPDEWARLAAGLPADCGNAVCNACGADCFVEDDSVTVLDAERDPFGFVERHVGRPFTWEELRWVGAGKESGQAGWVCLATGTEFDEESGLLRLVRTQLPALHRFVGRLETVDDWHRLAHGLPLAREDDTLRANLPEALRQAYRTGALDVDGRDWSGPATRVLADGDDVREVGAQLVIGEGQLVFGGLLRKFKMPVDAASSWHAKGHSLLAELKDGGVEEWVVEPLQWTVALESGKHTVTLTSEDLALRLTGRL